MSDIDTRPACHACGTRTNAAHETGYCSSLCDMRAQHAQACHERDFWKGQAAALRADPVLGATDGGIDMTKEVDRG